MHIVNTHRKNSHAGAAGGKPVGRISVFENRRFNSYHNRLGPQAGAIPRITFQKCLVLIFWG